MNYFFMLRYPGLMGEVTLANFPPVDSESPGPGTQVAHLAWSDGAAWHTRALETLEPGKTATFGEDRLPHDIPAEALPVFFLYPERLPEELDRLIKAPIMNTAPAWRANILLRSATTATSYQGEYPDGMLDLPKASLLSFGPFLQTGSGLHTFCLLVNLRADPNLNEGHICIATMRERKILKQMKARSNRCTVIDLNDLGENAAGDMLCISSRDMTGIPIYFSHDLDFRHLSLEHSHPPAEMVIFGNRHKIQSRMKNWWLNAFDG